MKQIFFDTEFTGLTDNAGLISIGLIDEAGYALFYAELSDTYVEDDCSDFCREHVLRHLGKVEDRIPMAALRERLEPWLAAQGPGVVLVCDSQRDVAQLDAIFPGGVPDNCTVKVLTFWENTRRRMRNRSRRIHQSFGLRMHHALDDAKANRILLAD